MLMLSKITSVLELEMNQLSLSEAEEARRQGETLTAFTITTAVFVSFPEPFPNVAYQLINFWEAASIISSLSVCLECFNIPTLGKRCAISARVDIWDHV